MNMKDTYMCFTFTITYMHIHRKRGRERERERENCEARRLKLRQDGPAAAERRESLQDILDLYFNVETRKTSELARYCGSLFQR